MTLVFKWLGTPEVTLGGRAVRLGSKAVSILALLSLEGRLRRRDLGRMLWSEANDPLNSVSAARVALGKQLGFHLGGDTETLHLEGDWSCDVHGFEGASALSDVRELQEVWDSWRGDFLTGVRLPEWESGFGEEFEGWLFDKRDALQSQRRDLGAKIGLKLIQETAYQAAIPYLEVTQNTNLEPREDAAQWLMLCLGSVARFDAALAVFNKLERSLQDELGVKPTIASQQTLATVRLGAAACIADLQALKPAQTTVVNFGLEETEAPFVGRETELEKLLVEFEHLRQAKSRLVLIAGEPGAGKSRLAQELAQQGLKLEGNLVVLQGVAAPTGLPFVVWDRVFKQLLNPTTLEQMPSLWRKMLAQVVPEAELGQPSESEFEPRGVFEALRFLLHQLEKPCLIVLDDLQWADQVSLELLLFLLDQAPGHGLLVVGTVRDTEASNSSLTALNEVIARQGRGTRLKLEGLQNVDIQSLAAHLGRMNADVENLSKSSGGNPLYVLELLQSKAHHMPERIQSLIQTRLEGLGTIELQVLEALTIIGNGGTQQQIRLVSGRSLDETSQASNHLEQIGLLRSDQYGTHFSHDLTLEVMQTQLSVNRRETLHLRAARALKNQTPQIALHYFVSRTAWEATDNLEAGKAFLEAGAWYALRGDLTSASLWFSRVLEQTQDQKLWCKP